MRYIDKCRAVLFTAILISLASGLAVAQSNSDSNAPISIGGFEHRMISGGQVHMNVCQQASCGLGSRVSYAIYAPSANPDFEDFKRAQETVLEQLKARAPEGTRIKLDPPERAVDDIFTVFTSYREAQSSDGTKLVTKSSLLFSEKVTISLISSSKDKETADANAAQFMLGLMVWSQTKH